MGTGSGGRKTRLAGSTAAPPAAPLSPAAAAWAEPAAWVSTEEATEVGATEGDVARQAR